MFESTNAYSGFAVDDVEKARAFYEDTLGVRTSELIARGVQMERYEDARQDERGIMRQHGPYIAWFRDPAGNVLSVLQER